jgi:hypothetical protein
MACCGDKPAATQLRKVGHRGGSSMQLRARPTIRKRPVYGPELRKKGRVSRGV